MLRLPLITFLLTVTLTPSLAAQGTRLLRQPTVSQQEIAFTYGADLWIVARSGGEARRLTSTPAVESDPHFSPDGSRIAFTSNRSGMPQVYVVSRDGGEPTRLTWHPTPSLARGWTPDGSRVFYASARDAAPQFYNRLWSVARTGGPSTMVPAPWGFDGSYSPDGRRLVVDRMSRWDGEWRSYRGGQNTALTILTLGDLGEVMIPNTDRAMDIEPVWLGNTIYFLSDRDWATNVWAYDVAGGTLRQITHEADVDIKALAAGAGQLVYEHDGWIHLLDPATGESRRVDITVHGDFPWAEPRWEDVSDRVAAASLSATGQRVLMEARGEIWTVPVEHGDARNLTRSSAAADRTPIWSPDGLQVAWFSSDGGNYDLLIAAQDGMGTPRRLSIAPSKMGWDPVWSPDGSLIAFADDDARVRVIEAATGNIRTADVNGTVFDLGNRGLRWSPDSKWLAYPKVFPNQYHRIVVWSVENGAARPITDALADAIAPAWDRDGRHLYFLASTDLALGSGWLNLSSLQADPRYAPYAMVLRNDDPTPFPLRSDEEPAQPPGDDANAKADSGSVTVRIDFDGIARRIVALPMPARRYGTVLAGPKGSVFIGEAVENEPGELLHKFVLKDAKASEFASAVSQVSISGDGKKLLFRVDRTWRVVGTGTKPEPGKGTVTVALRMQLDRMAEWRQMFDDVWRFEREYFYDPGMHGNDWDAVRERYRPLVPFVRHRADLNYVFDQVNGELSVGHSFVRGGDFPDVDTIRVGLLGADLVAERGRWRIQRIYRLESWNPGLSAPLDRPGLRVREGDYLLQVNGVELTAADDPYRLLDGTAGRQTVLQFSRQPNADGAWTETVEPIRSEFQLRQRAWVEDNRRKVDSLSGGRLAYVWVPNTGQGGYTSFNRYFFAQQDKLGAVIDERYNQGGFADDYMVDHLSRFLRGALTNEADGGSPMPLPQGVLGPKVLLINEESGSGGDYFPWTFRQLQIGPLIGRRTWGGLVANSSPYPTIDGGRVTAPYPAVYDPINQRYMAENEGIPPDIEVINDARSVAQGGDPQLERAVAEALRLVEAANQRPLTVPPFSRPSRRPGK
ncbi:MAG TPA: PDZ domain-containing protein [Gemmatimonadales bacterium]